MLKQLLRLLCIITVVTAMHASAQWSKVQQSSKNSVVQLFVTSVKFDFEKPYNKNDEQYSKGTGFFVNAEGDIVTNTHVVHEVGYDEQGFLIGGIEMQMPALGKHRIPLTIKRICPQLDLALLEIAHQQDKELIRKTLGAIPYVTLGDSNALKSADIVLALGYPLGDEGLKSTDGLYSGFKGGYLQISAPVNPGSSGGPLFNSTGDVVGINVAYQKKAQNVGYSIPVNALKKVIAYDTTDIILRWYSLGIALCYGSEYIATYYKNPLPSGCVVADIVEGSSAWQAGLRKGDMIYEINGYGVDQYYQVTIPNREEKVGFFVYVEHIEPMSTYTIVYYRHGVRCTAIVDCNKKSPLAFNVRKHYPWLEQIPYEAFAGMIIMPLTLNHAELFDDQLPWFKRYFLFNYQNKQPLIISYIHNNCVARKLRTVWRGDAIRTVNGIPVSTLAEFYTALRVSKETGYVVIELENAEDNYSQSPLVLPLDIAIQDTLRMKQWHIPLSSAMKSFVVPDDATVHKDKKPV